MDAAKKFIKFLADHNIENVSKFDDNIMDLVSDNYDLLSAEIMRAMVDCALSERDVNVGAGGNENDLLGSWGVIIDTFKEQTMLRRERAGANMQQLISTGLQSGDSELQALIDEMWQKGHVDKTLIDLLKSSLDDIDKYPGNDNIKSVLHGVFLRLQSAPPAIPNLSSHVAVAREVSTTGKISEEDLIVAGEQLRQMVQRNSGDANKLRAEVARILRGGASSSLSSSPSVAVSLTGAAFQKVLDDNITACRDIGYTNKTKFLEFLKQIISDMSTSGESSDSLEPGGSKSSGSVDHINHAPQFVDDSRTDIKVSLVEEDNSYIDIAPALEALSITATGARSDKQGGSINNKKKSLKSANKKKVGDTAASIGAHLEEHGWAVCDHALPEDLVKRVRVEAGLFTDFYEKSEIWVGKKSDIGAQLSVPSVRGDRVLWMCGGHKAVEGVTRNVKTAGEVEPCRLEVKAQAPIRKFAAMKDLVATIDCLVSEMKKKCTSLSGLFERSDAMLAMYPGEGARFARHVDNTTSDGRRLTVLAYLNPSWTPEQGGALRLFTKNKSKEGSNDMNAIDVFPLGGRLAFFYSADIPHEVRPTFGMRHSITLWYYDKEEREAAVQASKDSGSSRAVAESSLEAQIAAKEFISELMGGDEVQEDGGLPSSHELQALSEKLKLLDDHTVGIISSITGAPSTESFREGFPLLSVEDLKQMRGLFRRMGLDDYSVS